MKVYLIRHGQSETNLSGKRAGQSDVKLTEQGYKDALEARRKLLGIKFGRVFSSDLSRALETARTALPGVEPEKVSDIREIDVGKIAGHTEAECVEMFGDLWTENYPKHNYAAFGGENIPMLKERVYRFMRFLETIENCENVAVFAHGGSIRSMLCYAFQADKEWNRFHTGNCGVSVLEYKDGYWSVWSFNN